MAIYTYRLGFAYATAPGSQVLFTTQSTQHVIVRDLVATNLSAAVAFLQVWIQTAGGRIDLLSASELQPNESVHWDGRQEMRIGDQLEVYCNATNWDVGATGYVFNLP